MEFDQKLDKILEEVRNEILWSCKKFKYTFASNHEWLGVLTEEFEELKNEIFQEKDVYHFNDKMREEAIQVAAMALKGLIRDEK